MENDSIDRCINESDIQKQYNILTGHCFSIAEGIRRVFGGQIWLISSVPFENFRDHAVVEINSCYYDGRGQVKAATIENEFIPDENWKGQDAHWFQINDMSNVSMYDDETARSVSELLRCARDDFE